MMKCFIGFFISIMLGIYPLHAQQPKHSFTLGDSSFLLDGKPFQVISGEIHYPRVPREAWRDRMKMAKAMGLNTIGTYVFWNIHEPQKGQFDFKGNNDIAEFIRIAQQEGLWVILRPSPYVCAEWEFGGYPYWLQNEKGLVVRSKEAGYLLRYRRYIEEIGKQLAGLQVNHGGNILMVQVENEYGSYGSDKEYLELNRKMFVDAGFDGLLYTCDPVPALKNGRLPGLLPAVNGIDRPAEVKHLIRSNHDGKGPFFIAEWYPAWFDWWGEPHHTIPAENYVRRLDSVLSAGISINMYMFHGGSTRDFMNGANYNDKTPYEPQVSSYDYDAPLDEAGNATAKFVQFRNVISKYVAPGIVLPDIPAAKPAISIPSIRFEQNTSVFDILPPAIKSIDPLCFEDLNQAYGFVLYRTSLNNAADGILKIKGLRDYAVIFVNGRKVGILDRRLKQDSLKLQLADKNARLDILVENMGRVNYGPYLLANRKGLTGSVSMNGILLKNWEMFKLPFNDISKLPIKRSKTSIGAPEIKSGTFMLQDLADTYFDMSDWGKGVVWINGHNLGRYWSIGPQQTLYVPAEWLKKGLNTVKVLELIKPGQTVLRSVEKPELATLSSE